jgi:hypothetical protein
MDNPLSVPNEEAKLCLKALASHPKVYSLGVVVGKKQQNF